MSEDRFEEEEERAEGTPSGADRPSPDSQASPGSPTEPGEYVEPPTEELFAFEARVEEGEVPDLDPVFRAALLESPESAIDEGEKAPEAAGDSGTDHEDRHTEVVPTAGDEPDSGEEPYTGDEPDSGEEPYTDEEPYTGEEPYTDEEPLTGEESYTDEEPHPQTEESELPPQSGVTAEQTAVLQATARSEVHEAIEFSRRTGRSWDPHRPPSGGDFDQPGRRPRYWWRFLLATLLIVGSFATATQASVMHVVNDITAKIGEGENKIVLPGAMLPDADGPQTIAILGSDVRTGGGAPSDDPGRSDTTMLLRLDPDAGQIAMLSIPRDLLVDIPGYGPDKFNAAYSYGGVKLTIQTLKQLTGLEINQVVNVDFQGFADVIDAIGCVFVDVDRHYFNDNAGLAISEQYATIDIEAGYQKLCGYDALDFARYRHTDSDLVRAARQQDLIGEVRNRLTFTEILKRNKELLKAFTDNTDSTLENSDDVFQLLSLLFDSKGAAVTEVSFPSTYSMINGISYVEATPTEIEAAVNQFLGFEDEPGPVGTLDEGEGARDRPGENARKEKKRQAAKQREQGSEIPTKENDGLVDASAIGLSEAENLDSQIARRDFPVYYPKRIPEGAIYETDQSRVYHTRDPDKNVYSAFRIVLSLFKEDGTHYFGLQGIRGWTDPPILEAPYDELEMDDRTFRVYPEGDRIRMVSWKEDDNVYWISNSLLLTFDNEQMLGMARSTRAFTPN